MFSCKLKTRQLNFNKFTILILSKNYMYKYSFSCILSILYKLKIFKLIHDFIKYVYIANLKCLNIYMRNMKFKMYKQKMNLV